MALSPEQILKEIRALPADERLRVVEQVVHEVAREVTPPAPIVQTSAAIWTDETDAEFETFQKIVGELRGADVWRAGDG
jgi:2,4-dienoyl-CoA reductase-like NADH-dependent reductase (Old Yellow Enzyme family)